MKKLITLFIIYYILFIAVCFSQSSITWQRLYDGQLHFLDGGMSSCIADSNNFYIGGYTTVYPNYYRKWVLKLNPYGDTIWTRMSNDMGYGQVYAMVSSGDGGCVITGYAGPAYAIKLNSSGNIVWNKTYGVNYVQCYDIKKTNDGGYVSCGRQNYTNGFIIKVDSLGNFQWQQVYPSNGFKSFRSILQISDGHYIVTGNNSDSGYDTVKTVVAKMDSVGNLLWEKDHVLDSGNSVGVNIYQNGNGYIIGCVGVSILKVDSIGNVIFFKVIRSQRTEYLGSMRVVNNKYVFASGLPTDTGGPSNGRVVITDTMGNVMKDRIFPAYGFIDFRSILPMNNGDFVFSGIADFDSSTFHRYEDVYAVRTDSNLIAPPIGITPITNQVTYKFELFQNYPNPFNPSSTIKFSIPLLKGVRGMSVRLTIYDILGREVVTLVNQEMKPGSYEVKFDGSIYASGLYFYRIEAGDPSTGSGQGYVETKKMVLLK